MTTAVSPSHPAYDPLLRLIHAWNALAIVGLIASSQVAEAFEHGSAEATVWSLHIQFGYALIGGLVARLVWGLVGPASARWSDLWHPRAWAAMLRGRFDLPPRAGHDVRASLAFLVLYGVLAIMAATGLALAGIEHDTGPLAARLAGSELEDLFEEPHEFGFALTLGFIGLHLGALAFHRFVLHAPVGHVMTRGKRFHAKETTHA